MREEEKLFFKFINKKIWKIFIANCYIESPLFEHQVVGNAGSLNVHPFLKNIDFDVEPTPYLQMISPPGQKGKQFYYRPEKF